MYSWDQMYELAVLIYSICMDMISAIAYGYLVRDFVKNRKIEYITGAIYIIPMLPSYHTPAAPSLLPTSGLSIFLGLLVICFLDRRRYLQKLFLAVTFFSVRWFAFRIESCIGVALGRLSTYYPGYWESETVVYLLFVITSVIEVVLGAVLLFGAVIWIKRAYRYKQEEMKIREFVLMTMPSAAGLMAYVVYRYMDDLYEATGNSTYDAPISYQLCNIFFYLTMYISVVSVIVLFQNINEKRLEEKQNELLAGQIEDMKHHISQVEELYREIRSMKHDMGNHVQVLENLSVQETETEAGKQISEQMQAYVSALKAQYSRVAEEICTGNPVTDVILMEKKKEAEEKGIAFTCDFQYPKDREVDAFDLSIILNNALENAIEAVEKKLPGYINIRSYMRKNAYMIEVINSYQDKITIDIETKLPYTTKEYKENHGYGLRNIRQVARKYHGEIDIETVGAEFCLSVMLCM